MESHKEERKRTNEYPINKTLSLLGFFYSILLFRLLSVKPIRAITKADHCIITMSLFFLVFILPSLKKDRISQKKSTLKDKKKKIRNLEKLIWIRWYYFVHIFDNLVFYKQSSTRIDDIAFRSFAKHSGVWQGKHFGRIPHQPKCNALVLNVIFFIEQ